MAARNTTPFRFRVSDAVAVPLRGMLLRLRVLEGKPDIDALRPGDWLRLRSPTGVERVVEIGDYAVTGGRQTQARLDRYGELDVLISTEDALRDGEPVEVGWQALPA